MSLAIRRAGPADAAAVRALTRLAYEPWVALIGREPWPMVADYDAAVRDHWVDLLERDGQLIALVEMIPAPDHLLIENLAVAPVEQGQGHARHLLAHAEREARAIGLAEIRLYTNQLFAENIAIYRHLGYRITREEPVAVGVVVHMAKAIDKKVP